MKTIKQIADELGVSKTAVRKHLTAEVRTKFAETISGVVCISEEGEMLIKSMFPTREPQTTFAVVPKNHKPQTDKVSATQFAVVSTAIAALERELEAKTHQLEAKDRQITDLTAMLTTTQQQLGSALEQSAAAQALHAGTMRQQLADGQAQDKPRRGFWGLFRR